MTRLSGIRWWLTVVFAGSVIAACRSDRSKSPSVSGGGSPASGGGRRLHLPPCTIDLTPIVDGRLGVLRVGMTTDELRSACPGAGPIAGTDEEGSSRTLYALPVSDRDTVFADLDTARGRVIVRSFSIGFGGPRTVEGIAVGSTYRETKSKYRELGAGDNEGRVYVWPEPDQGISFALSVGRDALDPKWRETPTVIPDSVHVIEVLIRTPLRKR